MKKRFISAIMAMSMCISTVPTIANASTDTTDLPLSECYGGIQQIYDEIILHPEESEYNRLITSYAKQIVNLLNDMDKCYDRYDGCTFLGVAESSTMSGDLRYDVYFVKQDGDKQIIDRNELTQVDTLKWYIDEWSTNYDETRRIWADVWSEDIFDKFFPKMSDEAIECFYSYTTEEDFDELSFKEQLLITAKVYEETGEFAGLFYCNVPHYNYKYIAEPDGNLYNAEKIMENGGIIGKCHYENSGEKLSIVDGKIVNLSDITADKVDILTTETLTGDANEDGSVDISDAVFIMQCLSNPDNYKFSEQGKANADYNGDGGVTAIDALEIQMLMIS